MIKNRLSVLLAERGLKITRVAKDTGISRNTITSIAQNDTEMIRLETVNALCKYLNVTPCQFFEYEPVDIDFSIEVVSMPFKEEINNGRKILTCNSLEADLFMDVNLGHTEESIDLTCNLESNIIFNANMTASESIEKFIINLQVEFEDEAKKEQFINEVYSKVDAIFYNDIYNALIETIVEGITRKLKSNISYYIENHLDLESDYIYSSNDTFFATQLEYTVENNLEFNIKSDVFKPF